MTSAPAVRSRSARRRDLVPLARVAVAVVLIGHGLIHLLGATLLWGLAEPGGLRYQDVHPASGTAPGVWFGAGWLVAAAGFCIAGILVWRRGRHWELITIASIVVSVAMLWPSAVMAAPGLVVDVAVLVLVPATSRLLAVGDRGVRVTSAIRSAWNVLLATETPTEVFDVSMVSGLPEPARRWLTHAIAPGTPLWGSVELTMHGRIKLRSWQKFTARQAISPTGYIWAATTAILGLPVVGFDQFTEGIGRMRWRLGGVIPVVTADGADVARSAAGRLISEGVFYPTAFRQSTWTEGSTTDQMVATRTIDGHEHRVEFTVADDGSLLSVLLLRWGNPAGLPFALYPFGVTVSREDTFQGVTVPVECAAAWWWGTEKQGVGEFFEATITSAIFR